MEKKKKSFVKKVILRKIACMNCELDGRKAQKLNNGKEDEKLKKMQCVLTGAIAGFINGLFGGGGGMIVVPLLTYFLKMEPKRAHATAILIILPMSIVSGLLYASSKSLDLALTIPTAIGVTGGGVIGALALKKLSGKWISIIFSIAMAVAGIKMLVF